MCGDCDIVPPETSAGLKLADVLARAKPLEVVHRVNAGLYTRAGKIQAGEVIIGAKHKAANIFHVSRGTVVVWDRFNGRRVLTAPFTEMTLPGTQRLGYAVTDVEGCNIFATEKTDVEEIEREMLYPFELQAALKEIASEHFENLICENCPVEK